jgi:hypothetical protein
VLVSLSPGKIHRQHSSSSFCKQWCSVSSVHQDSECIWDQLIEVCPT